MKFEDPTVFPILTKSHPTWVRGLKFSKIDPSKLSESVAPHVGAWIEIEG